MDVLFGPAYKGIPLATATAIGLASEYDVNTPYAFNRKEEKDHGEGGRLVGAALKGKVTLIDDVITAGTAINESLALMETCEDAQLTDVVIALNRQEKGRGGVSPIDTLKKKYDIHVHSIVTLNDIIEYLEAEKSEHLQDTLLCLRDYRDEFCI